MTLIAVLDYGIGNLHSAQKALQRVGADARLTADPALVRDAAGVVLPGVGNFGRCLQALEESGLDDLAIECAGSGRPFLGVCVGMQMLYEGSEESPDVPGLGVLPGVVRRLPDGVKRPQMQWNTLDVIGSSAALEGIERPTWMYFVHSYAPDPADPDATDPHPPGAHAQLLVVAAEDGDVSGQDNVRAQDAADADRLAHGASVAEAQAAAGSACRERRANQAASAALITIDAPARSDTSNQNGSGKSRMRFESGPNCHVPSAKKRAWNDAKAVSKATAK